MTADVDAAGGATGHVHVHRVETILDDWYSLRRYTFDCRGRDGVGVRLTRYVCERGSRAAILPYRRSLGTVLLIRQFRMPVLVAGHSDGMILEAPGGLLDGRSPEDAVRRELEEEVGLRVRDVDQVLTTFLNPVLVAERMHLFVTELDGAERIGQGGGIDSEGENIETVEIPLDEALALVRQRSIVDAKTILLLYWLSRGRHSIGD